MSGRRIPPRRRWHSPLNTSVDYIEVNVLRRDAGRHEQGGDGTTRRRCEPDAQTAARHRRVPTQPKGCRGVRNATTFRATRWDGTHPLPLQQHIQPVWMAGQDTLTLGWSERMTVCVVRNTGARAGTSPPEVRKTLGKSILRVGSKGEDLHLPTTSGQRATKRSDPVLGNIHGLTPSLWAGRTSTVLSRSGWSRSCGT